MAQNIFIIIMCRYVVILSQFGGAQVIGQKISDWFTPSYEIDGKDICFRLKMDPKILILVASTPHKADQRNAIRYTWGSFGHARDIAVGFVLGQSNSSIAKNVSQEAKLHDDLIVSNFVDSYYNMTLKTLTMLDWAEKFCPMAKFLLKIDEDMFLNPKFLLEFTRSKLSATKKIFGIIWSDEEPNRDRNHKYYIPAAEYPLRVLPPHASGHVYLMTADCIRPLRETAMQFEYIRLEDVFLTGIVASKVSIQRVLVNNFLFLEAPITLCKPFNVIAVHKVPPKLMHTYWKRVMDDILSLLCLKEEEIY